MPEPPPPFSSVVALLAVSRRWEAAYARALEPLGLTIRKHGLLGHLTRDPGVSFSELARRAGITVQSVHGVVRSLVEAGYVDDRVATPGARSALQVTPSGFATLEAASVALREVDDRLLVEQPALARGLAEVVRETWSRDESP